MTFADSLALLQRYALILIPQDQVSTFRILIYSFYSLYSGSHVNGSYAEVSPRSPVRLTKSLTIRFPQYVVSPARYTSRIPDGVSDELAGPIVRLCLYCTVCSSVLR